MIPSGCDPEQALAPRTAPLKEFNKPAAETGENSGVQLVSGLGSFWSDNGVVLDF